MTTYKDPFIKAWNRLLKNDFFPNILSNAQPLSIEIAIDSSWDWLSNDSFIRLDFNGTEIIQCNYDDDSFKAFINFGHGYKYLNIPFKSIRCIFIGNNINYILNPAPVIPFSLKEEQITYLNKGVCNG